jgi:hypothetical protein
MPYIMKSNLSYKIDAIILCAALLIAFTGIFFIGDTETPPHGSSELQQDRVSEKIETGHARCLQLVSKTPELANLIIDSDSLTTPSGAIAFQAHDPRRPNEIAALLIDYSGQPSLGKLSFKTPDGKDLVILRQSGGVFAVGTGSDQNPGIQILSDGAFFEQLEPRSPRSPIKNQ